MTRDLSGRSWVNTPIDTDCRAEVCDSSAPLPSDAITEAVITNCVAVIDQLAQTWRADMLQHLEDAGGLAYCNCVVGFDNVNVAATESAAELTSALTFAAARRIAEGDPCMRSRRFLAGGWLENLMLCKLLWGRTLGIVGAGRIGSAYARMLVTGHRMDLIYHDWTAHAGLEDFVHGYAGSHEMLGEKPVVVRRAEALDEPVRMSDVISLHTNLNESTPHLIGAERFATMKDGRSSSTRPAACCMMSRLYSSTAACTPASTLLSTSTGASQRPLLAWTNCATWRWLPTSGPHRTGQRMAALAAANVDDIPRGLYVWNRPDVQPFLGDRPPAAAQLRQRSRTRPASP